MKAEKNLEELKTCIFMQQSRQSIRDAVERCYDDMLDEYDYSRTTIFLGLMEMIMGSEKEFWRIRKVIDFVKFPVKKRLKIKA